MSPALPYMQLLSTPRCQLEPLRSVHAPEMFAVLADPEIYRFIPVSPPRSGADLAVRYGKLESRISPDGREHWLNWVIVIAAEQRPIGLVEVTVFADGSALLAYQLSPASWGHGYATEACQAVLAHLPGYYAVQRVEATVDIRNLRSIHLLERLGFTRQLTRPSEDVIAGQATTEHVYALDLANAPATTVHQ